MRPAQLAYRLGLGARGCGLVLLLSALALVPILVSPAGAYPIDDDWSYAQAVRDQLLTGTYQHSVWIDTAFVAQAWWGVLVSRVLGFSHTSLRLGTMLLAAGALVLFYLLLCRMVRPLLALSVTLLLLFHPLFLHLAYTFMTDVPFLATMLAAIWCACCALDSALDSRPSGEAVVPQTTGRLWWLAAASALVGLACLVRQIGIVLVPAVLLGALPELRALSLLRRWGLLVALVLPFALVIGAGALAAGPKDVGVEVRFVDLLWSSDPSHVLQIALREVAISAALLGLSAAPVVPLILPRLGIRRWTRWRWLLAGGGLLPLAVACTWTSVAGDSLSPLFGNTLSPAGFTVSGLHPRAISVDAAMTNILAGLGLTGAATLLVAAGKAPPPGPLPLRLLLLAAIGTLAITIGYGPIGGPANGLYDRYLLPALPGVLALAAYAVRERRAAAPLLVAGAVLFAGWSVPWQREYLARQTAVWTVAETLVAQGVPPEEIDAGFEWAGWTRGEAVVEQARIEALQAGEPRRFVQLVVTGLYRPHGWYVGFGPLGSVCGGQPLVTVPYDDGWLGGGEGGVAYGLRRCRLFSPRTTAPAPTQAAPSPSDVE